MLRKKKKTWAQIKISEIKIMRGNILNFKMNGHL